MKTTLSLIAANLVGVVITHMNPTKSNKEEAFDKL